MKLTAGILRREPGWELLLQQIGLEWKTVSASEDFRPDELGAIIVNASPTSLQEKGLLEYVEAGGAALATYGAAHSFVHTRMKTAHFTTLAPYSFDKFSPCTMMDIYSPGIRETRTSDTHHHFPEIYQLGKGILVSVPFDVNALILDTRSKRKNFYAGKTRLPSEVTSAVSKGALRRFITEILQYCYSYRGIPFVHKWYYPNARHSVFTFRVDSDQGTLKDIDDLHGLCDRYSIKTMWFVDTKSHEQWLSRFKNFGKQEVGIHCYEHLSYSTDELNFQNFSRAQSLLNQCGITAQGAAAPYGTWNLSVAAVFEQLGMQFSSEFSLDYDDLPFFPFLNDRFSPVLQMPIHPICVGSMLRSGYSSAEMKEYFRQLIDLKILLREPLCLYHHPTHHHLEIFEDVFQYVRLKHVENLSYSEYAEWWKKRNAIDLKFEYHRKENSVTATASDSTSNVYWRIVLPDGKEAITNSGGLIPINSLHLQSPAPKPPVPADIARIRRFDGRHFIVNLLDMWYKRTQ